MIVKQKDLKDYRCILFNKQKGIDPITLQKILKPVLDHSHVDGYIRAVLDNNTNQFEGKVVSAFNRFLKNRGLSLRDVLQRLLNYIEEDYSMNPLHPGYVNTSIKKFGRMKANYQKIALLTTLDISEIPETKAERTQVYKELLMDEKNIWKP